MWPSASRSDPPRRPLGALALALTAALASPSAAAALDDALARIFPAPVTVTEDTLFLTDEQTRRAEEEAGTALRSKIVSRYVARKREGDSETVVGYAYLDMHVVRTVSETLLIALDAEGRVTRVEVLAFEEPREYLPSPRWLRQFEGRGLDDDLQIKRAIRALSGATLSSRAATEAVRRVLAVHRAVRSGGVSP